MRRTMFRVGLLLGFMIGGGAGASHYSRLSGALLLLMGMVLALFIDGSMRED